MNKTDRNVKLHILLDIIALSASCILAYFVTSTRPITFAIIIITFIFIKAAKQIALRIKSISRPGIRAIYAGEPDMYDDFIHHSKMSGINFMMLGYADMKGVPIEGIKCLGSIDDFEAILKNNPCEQIIFTRSLSSNTNIEPYLKIADEMGIVIRIIWKPYELEVSQSFAGTLGPFPMITYHSIVLDKVSLAIKRCVDIVGALLGIMITSPIMLAVAVAIKLDSPGPAIFSQIRVGCNGKRFKIYKFRSMYVDSEKLKSGLMTQNQMDDSRLFKIKNDPRVTRVGKFIRRTSIDEIPQFFNVLAGDMSLVGTRPPTEDEVARYDRSHWRRISIKPGITGVWQTNGRNDVKSFEDIVKMDISYIERWSIFLDFILILRTIKALFKRTGAY